MMRGIQIIKGKAPKAIRGPRNKYPFIGLAVGDHFVVKKIDANAASIRACATHAGKKLGRSFSVCEQESGDVTVERTK